MTQHHFYQTLIDLGFPVSEAEAMLRTANLWVEPTIDEVDDSASREYEQITRRSLLTPDMITRESLRILQDMEQNTRRMNVLYGAGTTRFKEPDADP